MRIELLVVKDCPHEPSASALLRRVLDDIGKYDVDFSTRVISDDTQAAASDFTGSPTFLVDGRDPLRDPAATTAVACRLYATRAGLAGLPDVECLRDALSWTAEGTSKPAAATSEQP